MRFQGIISLKEHKNVTGNHVNLWHKDEDNLKMIKVIKVPPWLLSPYKNMVYPAQTVYIHTYQMDEIS